MPGARRARNSPRDLHAVLAPFGAPCALPHAGHLAQGRGGSLRACADPAYAARPQEHGLDEAYFRAVCPFGGHYHDGFLGVSSWGQRGEEKGVRRKHGTRSWHGPLR